MGGAPEAYGSRHVCLWVSVRVILRDSCSHFLRDRWKWMPKTCNASLTQYYLEMKSVNFGLVALLSSYGIIFSPRRLLPAIQSLAKNKFLTAGCLSRWQFNLYNNSDGDLSESQRTTLPKLHSLSFAYLSITWTAYNWRRGLIWHAPPQITFSVTVLCVNRCLAALLLILKVGVK